jgi:hypothetical protein
MQRVSDRWEGLSVYDVQAVYKFLETAYVIAKKTYIVPADDVLESRDWLVKAKGNNASVVAKALPNGQPEQVIRDVDDIEAIRFRRLWTEIDGLPCGDIGMQLMEAYREAIRGLPSPERRKAVISSVGISYAEIQKRLNICAAKIAQDSALDVEKRREALRPQLEATNREIERKPPSEVLQALENDQA